METLELLYQSMFKGEAPDAKIHTQKGIRGKHPTAPTLDRGNEESIRYPFILIKKHGFSAHMADFRSVGVHIVEFSHVHPFLARADGP